jgi:hypothetical protein
VTSGRLTVVVALGATQTVAWASSYYMPAVLGAPIATTLHLPTSVFFGSRARWFGSMSPPPCIVAAYAPPSASA